MEPTNADLTTITDRATTKWHDLINALTALPTTVDIPPRVVGLWEGGGYYAHGIFRPQNHCQMRDLEVFCAVCERTMRKKLSSHCTACEIDSISLACTLSSNLGLLTCLAGDCGIGSIWRWPIPVCLSCPFQGNRPDDEIRYVLQGDRDNFKVRIIDDQGTVVAEGRRSQTGLEAQFRASHSRQYFVEVSGGSAKTAQLALASQVFRNGKLQILK